MKKFCLIFLIGAMAMSLLAGCEVSEPAKVDREIVEAVIVNSGHGRGGDWIKVAYDGVISSWSNERSLEYDGLGIAKVEIGTFRSNCQTKPE